MPSKRMTLLDVDTLLQGILPKQLSTVQTIDKGTLLLGKGQTQLTLGHLSDERTGLHVRESEWNPTLDQEFYPVAQTKMSMNIGVVQLDAADPAAIIAQPAADNHELHIQCIRVVASALAAPRDITISLFDGANNIPLFITAAAQWATGEDFLVWPVDLSTHMTGAIDVIGVPPLFVNNTLYLYAEAAGLVAAETFDVYFAQIAVPYGDEGLRQ